MITPTDEQKKKLPKWAQQYVQMLEGRVDSMRDHLKGQVDKDTKVSIRDMISDTAYRIPDYATIEFKTAQGRVDVHMTPKGELIVNTLTERLAVMPRAANSVSIETKD